MEQHAIPRQVTTFQFKLIGFMTLKQFLILAVFGGVALMVYFVFQGNIIGIFFAVLILGAGAAVALLPIQDRMIDEWLVLVYKGLGSQTRYIYHKNNKNTTLHYLHDLYFAEDPHRVMAHIESKEKLAAYLIAQKKGQQDDKHRQHVDSLMQHSTKQLKAKQFTPDVAHDGPQPQAAAATPGTPQTPLQRASQQGAQASGQQLKHPFFTGVIHNNRNIPLPGIMVYIKDAQDNAIRILKTNPHGIFATYTSLPAGTYAVEIKDPNNNYFFDRMNIQVGTSNPTPYEFRSREML